MSAEVWLAIAGANFLACVAPGQNVALVSGAVLSSGPRSGIAAMLGVLLAEIVWVALALFVVVGALRLDAGLLAGAQIAGGFVVASFGVATLRTRPGKVPSIRRALAACDVMMALKGLAVGLANPLNLVFFVSIFPLFIAVDALRLSGGTVLYYVSAILLSSALGLMPYFAASRLLTGSRHATTLHRVSGAALLLLGGLCVLDAGA